MCNTNAYVKPATVATVGRQAFGSKELSVAPAVQHVATLCYTSTTLWYVLTYMEWVIFRILKKNYRSPDKHKRSLCNTPFRWHMSEVIVPKRLERFLGAILSATACSASVQAELSISLPSG